MTDPRKTVITTDRSASPEAAKAYDLIYSILQQATRIGCQNLKCSGGSFVTSALGIWAMELRDIDREAGRDFLRALADMIALDEGASDQEKEEVEARRADAVRRIMASLDLMMTKPEGSG